MTNVLTVELVFLLPAAVLCCAAVLSLIFEQEAKSLASTAKKGAF
jgi:hypothetical protein